MVSREEMEKMDSTTYRNLKCEERIDIEKEDRFKDFEMFQLLRDVNDVEDFQDLEEDEQEKLKKWLSDEGYEIEDIADFQETYFDLFDAYGLGISQYIEIKIDLSWGGPADFVKLTIDKETKEVMSGTYHFQDWFDGATRDLTVHELEMLEDLYQGVWDY